MKRFLSSVACVLALTACHRGVYMFATFHEPATAGLRLLYSRDALHWKDLDTIFVRPRAGAAGIMRDPSIARGPDGTYHFVWTTAWTGNEGFGYASSKDLLHWSDQRLIPIMAAETAAVNVWAPEIYYEKEEQRFIIIWATTIPYRFPKGIEDEKNNHRIYCTTTKDFLTFTPAKLFFDAGFSAIDAVIVKRRKHDYVLVVKDNTRPYRNIRVAFSDRAMGPYTAVTAPFTPPFTEGPTVARAGRRWLIFFDAYRDKKYGAVQTRRFTSFADITRKTAIPAATKHGTIFKVPAKTFRHLKAAVQQ